MRRSTSRLLVGIATRPIGKSREPGMNIKENTVAATCDVCGKGPGFGHNISHSHRRTKRRWNPNIQRVRAMVGATPKRLNVCTSCIKAGKVTRA
jgi:large subunit ribosomal protein L28